MKLVTLFLALLGASQFAAAQQPFATIAVINLGCSTSSGSDTFPISSWNFQVTREIVYGGGNQPSRTVYGDFYIQMNDDACGLELTVNRSLQRLTMTQVDPNTGKRLMVIDLTGAKVARSVTNGGVRAVVLTYSAIDITTYYPDPKKASSAP
jgi:hypothetical protein